MKRNLFVALVLLAAPALTFAATCNPGSHDPNSPENPSAVLAVIGGAGLAWRSLRARLRR